MRLSRIVYLNAAILCLIAGSFSIRNQTPVLESNSPAITSKTIPVTTVTPIKPVSSYSSVDLSKVNWIDLARLFYGKCGEYHDLAIQAGWPESQWPTLSKVMYR